MSEHHDQHKVTDLEEYDHVRIRNRVIEDYLSVIGVHAYAVYSVLKLRANNTTGRCFPGLKHIEEIAGLSRPTVIKAIKTLEEYGLIEVSHRKSSAGDAASNEYFLKTPPVSVLKRDLRGSKGDLQPDKEVVIPADYPVNAVDGGSKGDLPPVVNDIDSNKSKIQQDSLNKTQQQQPATSRKASNEKIVVVVPSDSSLLSRMVEQGVTPSVAQSLIDKHGEEVCQRQLKLLPARRATDPAAVLVRSIREGWSIAPSRIPRPRPAPRLMVAPPSPAPVQTEEEAERTRAHVAAIRGKLGIRKAV